ncbi:hypothetical protein F0562_006643 [Nyssa sinensis]|uniref:Uncharacterized protein n=1 Tax=Nyssa sinensis TaxID=561372 RepID=A0A5J5ALN0_9ASTE|nr:hypothetical protein F0562_006643 [Nyssa sinensis]
MDLLVRDGGTGGRCSVVGDDGWWSDVVVMAAGAVVGEDGGGDGDGGSIGVSRLRRSDGGWSRLEVRRGGGGTVMVEMVRGDDGGDGGSTVAMMMDRLEGRAAVAMEVQLRLEWWVVRGANSGWGDGRWSDVVVMAAGAVVGEDGGGDGDGGSIGVSGLRRSDGGWSRLEVRR